MSEPLRRTRLLLDQVDQAAEALGQAKNRGKFSVPAVGFLRCLVRARDFCGALLECVRLSTDSEPPWSLPFVPVFLFRYSLVHSGSELLAEMSDCNSKHRGLLEDPTSASDLIDGEASWITEFLYDSIIGFNWLVSIFRSVDERWHLLGTGYSGICELRSMANSDDEVEQIYMLAAEMIELEAIKASKQELRAFNLAVQMIEPLEALMMKRIGLRELAALTKNAVKKPKDNFLRNQWIYEQCINNTPHKKIVSLLQEKSGWARMRTEQGIRKAAATHAKDNNLPPIPSRRSK